MPKALIVYATRSGQTKKIAHLVAEGIQLSGVDTTIAPAVEIEDDIDLGSYDALVIGSATYHADMMQSVKNLLTMAEKSNLRGKVGAAFGAYGWSGEAPDQVFDAMKKVLNMDMMSRSLKLKPAQLVDDEEIAKDYGREIAKKIGH